MANPSKLRQWNLARASVLAIVVACFSPSHIASGADLMSGTLAFEDLMIGLPGLEDSDAAWSDWDQDGLPEFLLAGWTGSAASSQLYRNRYGTNLNHVSIGLPGTSFGAVVWADFDMDGFPDVLMTGNSQTRLLRNLGGTNFVEVTLGFPGLSQSAAAWGDYDADGDPDIALAGTTASSRLSRIYRNEGGTNFVDIDAGLPGISIGSVSWGDIDNDNDLDLLLTGSTGATRISRIYMNHGTQFVDMAAGLPGVSLSTAIFGDYDRDGDLDVALSGRDNGFTPISHIYRNDGGQTFVRLELALPGLAFSAAAWIDANKDDYLDLVLSGEGANGIPQTHFFLNEAGTNFVETQVGLTDISRGVVAGADFDLDGDIDLLVSGRDSSSNRISVVYRNTLLGPDDPPEIRTLTATEVLFTTATLHGEVNPHLSPTITWFEWGTSTEYGRAGAYQSWDPAIAWFAYSTSLSNLLGETEYHYRAAASNAFGVAYGSDQHFRTEPVAEFIDIQANLPGVLDSMAAWGDYDQDGDLDLFLGGYTGFPYYCRIYRNDGNGTFTDINAGLPGVGDGTAAWGDYDNDGDLDLVLSGDTAAVTLCRLYRNEGNDSFVDANAGFPIGAFKVVAWGDCDNDGDLDLLLHGAGPGRPGREPNGVFRNMGNSQFVRQETSLPQLGEGMGAWGDFDNDGDLDLVLAGKSAEDSYISRIYRNDGNFQFVDIQAGLLGMFWGAVACGDYDSDGDLDLCLTGVAWISDANSITTRIYRNDGSNHFVEVNSSLPGAFWGAVAAWGDYDNDGDLDLLLVSISSPMEEPPRIFRNEGGDTFIRVGANLPSVYRAAAGWGDYDNDGDLDLVLAGLGDDTPGPVGAIYRNEIAVANTPPSAPTGLAAQVRANAITFQWNVATDAETPSPGLNYNLVVGSTPNGIDRVSPMADTLTGFRRVVRFGEANHSRAWTLHDPPPGPLYWSVQAIDSAFQGGPFAAVQTVLLFHLDLSVSNALAHLRVQGPTNTSFLLQWSSNLTAWDAMTVLTTDAAGSSTFVDPIPSHPQPRFYRVQDP